MDNVTEFSSEGNILYLYPVSLNVASRREGKPPRRTHVGYVTRIVRSSERTGFRSRFLFRSDEEGREGSLIVIASLFGLNVRQAAEKVGSDQGSAPRSPIHCGTTLSPPGSL